ncbi:MAG: hypothetical protein D3908_04095 [Candidatus Electrothrix sp. AUS4]|nr:hypothetical protein [Candidatus Electrothrix sp. AUS4]
MKKTADHSDHDDLQPEYRFDYSKARPNRFAERITEDNVVVVLDPDVAQVFSSAKDVNAVLRALIQSMPKVSSPVKTA